MLCIAPSNCQGTVAESANFAHTDVPLHRIAHAHKIPCAENKTIWLCLAKSGPN